MEYQKVKYDCIIGIDPGVNTGLAVKVGGELKHLYTFTAIEAEESVRNLAAEYPMTLVVVEDARKRKVFRGGAERYQGAGSVKRDSKRWEEFLQHHKIAYELVEPSGRLNAIAKNPIMFTEATGYKVYSGNKITVSEHARCAAMLILNR